MQIKYLHKNFYKLYQWSRTQECLDVYRQKYENQANSWKKLKAEGVSDQVCQEVVGISRATYFRHLKILKDLDRGIMPPSKKPKSCNKPRWGEAEKQLVLTIRRGSDTETYGKDKIGRILRRDHGLNISDSTVGRILKSLKNRGLITKSRSAVREKRNRLFAKGHANRWEYKQYAKMLLGERVQIDHMTVTKNGLSMKHFQAWDRKSKYIHAEVFSNAKSRSAKKFLLALLAQCPFKIGSIQVDGGSEFMGEFEEACAELKLPLIVLPPSKPKYNGGVERGNRIFREEFYARRDLLSDTIGSFRADLKEALKRYNTYRPHHGLKGLTPMEYIQGNTDEVRQSHML